MDGAACVSAARVSCCGEILHCGKSDSVAILRCGDICSAVYMLQVLS